MTTPRAFALAALLAATAVPAAAEKPPGCATVLVAPRGGETDNSDRFSVAETIDLTFTVLLDESLAGDHVVEVRVFTPRGHLFQSMAVPIGLDGGEPRVRKVPGYPFPMEERTAHTVEHGNARYLAVDLDFAVAGTPIVTSALFGKWRVQAAIDGSRQPCSPPSFFRLEP